ncbi:sporulation integral membrane protein YlbJ [Chengkuizengella sp. 2205SS18-9]|uniref:Sporulation integral membrane protein YlbJ n=2 Tax=Chengkuizengella axinellae TaxID=3064388 RepID=A0ABT9IT67_9BACL|nr:sporulation integral membrane protein YlbJ [Chengkuizengella sp. 2205SS18-9]MDP5272528.1 sporulation integral membrane protein YlbJ [Chengkuizengella sp. 2205SS18-9]
MIPFISLIFVVLFFIYPTNSLEAALRGIAIWWDVLFPALFPFLVVSEILLGIGIVHFFGTLFDPIMRPLFRVPGIGGFVMTMGFASGYPVGARLTSKLWEQKLVNQIEGERLVSFTSTSDPIFLIGAVSVGFFHDANLALILATSHYGAGIIVGLMMRFHGRNLAINTTNHTSKQSGFILFRAFRSMHKARLEDGRALGVIIYEAIEASIRLIFVVGGLVVFFSVILEILTITNFLNLFNEIFHLLLPIFGLPAELSQVIINGIFEVTLGAKSAADADSSLMTKTAAAAFVVSWGGLSVHAQIMSLLHTTNLRYHPFLFARLCHGIFAAVLVFLLWTPFQSHQKTLTFFIPAMNISSETQYHSLIFSFSLWIVSFLLICTLSLYFIYMLFKLFQFVFKLH